MSNRKTWYPALCAVFIAAVFAGCGLFSKKGGDSSAVPAGFHQSSSVSVSTAVSTTASGVSSGSPEASAPEASSQDDPKRPSDSQPGQVLPIETDDKAFNKKFAANPIDQKYIKESNKAVSNIDMIKVSDKYRDIWKAEVDHAYAELEKCMMADSGEKPKKYRAEQEKWRSGRKAALQKIADDSQSVGGSMAQVDQASKVMDYYRGRAAQLYRELYGYNKDYSYAYTKK